MADTTVITVTHRNGQFELDQREPRLPKSGFITWVAKDKGFRLCIGPGFFQNHLQGINQDIAAGDRFDAGHLVPGLSEPQFHYTIAEYGVDAGMEESSPGIGVIIIDP